MYNCAVCSQEKGGNICELIAHFIIAKFHQLLLMPLIFFFLKLNFVMYNYALHSWKWGDCVQNAVYKIGYAINSCLILFYIYILCKINVPFLLDSWGPHGLVGASVGIVSRSS